MTIFQGLYLNCQFCDDAPRPLPLDLNHEPDDVEDHQELLQQEPQNHQQAAQGQEGGHVADHGGRVLHRLQHDPNLCQYLRGIHCQYPALSQGSYPGVSSRILRRPAIWLA